MPILLCTTVSKENCWLFFSSLLPLCKVGDDPFNWGRWTWSWRLSVWCITKVKEFSVYDCHPIGLFITVNSCCYCHRRKLLQHFTISFPNESSHITTGSLKQMLLSYVCGANKACRIAHVWLWHQNVYFAIYGHNFLCNQNVSFGEGLRIFYSRFSKPWRTFVAFGLWACEGFVDNCLELSLYLTCRYSIIGWGSPKHLDI